MAEIFKFQKQEQEEVCCTRCELHEDFFRQIIASDSEEQVHELIGVLIDVVDRLSYRQALVDDLHNKMEILDALDSAERCDCEECCEDDCEY